MAKPKPVRAAESPADPLEALVAALRECGSDDAARELLQPLVNAAHRFNAELQHSTDVAGTWLLLVTGDGIAIPLTVFGPDRAALRARVLDVINRAE